MKIQIVGTGCPKCKMLTANTQQALGELGVEAEIEKVERIADIARMGVMMTPGFAIDGVLKSSGHVLTVAQIKELVS